MANHDDLLASADFPSQNGECHIYCTCVILREQVMVVEEVEQIDLGVNMPGRVKVAEKVCSTNRLWSEHAWTSHGGRRSSTDSLWSKCAWTSHGGGEVAQTVFGVNMLTEIGVNVPGMSHSSGRGSTDIFEVNVTRQVKVTEEVAP